MVFHIKLTSGVGRRSDPPRCTWTAFSFLRTAIVFLADFIDYDERWGLWEEG